MAGRNSIASCVKKDIPIQAGLERHTVSFYNVHPFASSLSIPVLRSSSRIFESLGFEITNVVGPVQDVALSPPDIDPTSSAGRLARNKLLRAWVELSAWVADYSKRLGRPTICVISPVYGI
jgi:hypothetical protein